MTAIPRERAYDIFLIGEAYCYAGQTLADHIGDLPAREMRYVVTANLAFGLELYLKSLALMDVGSIRPSHDLAKLFGDLPPNTQDAIRDSHKEYLKSDAHQRTCMAAKHRGEDPNKLFEFDSSLAASNRAFEKSRYPYDPDYSDHAYLAVPIERATRKVIIDRHPAWANSFVNLQSRPDKSSTSQVQ
jgi:hypothetical protein